MVDRLTEVWREVSERSSYFEDAQRIVALETRVVEMSEGLLAAGREIARLQLQVVELKRCLADANDLHGDHCATGCNVEVVPVFPPEGS